MKIVKKIWGYEKWIVNRNYCGKFLIIKKGYRGSLHYHKKKDETFYILKGKISLELGNRKKILKPGDVQRIKPKQKHRFTGIENSKIIEFSTHHKDSDTYRLVFGEKVDSKKLN